MTFKKVNNIAGWIICAIACAVYLLTMEATASLWDTGEFISSVYKLQVPHPPGAPLFILLGRIFIVLFGGSNPAKAVNIMSALSSGFTILFLFWTITHFAKKLVAPLNVTPTASQTFAIISSGVVGALAYTFSDSFWFSAVEGEVYALSSLFTALVFWAILKWEHSADEPGADKWIVFIFFMMGLSIGVHLLNLLTIPAIVMVYYFKRYQVTRAGTFWAFITGCLITGFVQVVVIQWSVKLAGWFDIRFVNNFGLPFFSGFIFFFVLLGFLLWLGLRMAAKNHWNFLRLGTWCVIFMLLGYSSYITTMIRSNANPAVDMYNVDNPNSLVGYLGRDQYGDFPLLYGQVFTASPNDYAQTNMKYTKGEKSYEEVGYDIKPVYSSEDKMLFPRVWDASNDQGHAEFYKDWLGLAEGERPNMAQNIYFFWTYQLNWMYWRYFLWNFAGKQNDIQGFGPGNVRDGNWKTGIGPLDNFRLGDQDTLPDSIKNNKANNKLFALPLILGLIGVVYQYFANRRDFLVAGLLFFFTGIAIVLYLNQAGNQPRERDYAFVGSFYAFAIWIGLGVLQIREWLMRKTKESLANPAAALVCLLLVPVLMGFQEWDDHDRSKKVLARDLAKDYLESCPPNAILFTYGDNDTYPLWYAQEVEGIRPDIRVINNSLLGIDWYINQLRYKINESAPIDVIWSAEQIRGRKRDYVVYNPRPDVNQEKFYDLYDVMKNVVGSEDPAFKVALQGGESINYLPARKYVIPVDEQLVRSNGTINKEDSVLSQMPVIIPENRNTLLKNDLAILNIIAANKWKRPICFTAPFTASELGFGNYVRKDGLTYRLVPISNNSGVNVDWMVEKLRTKFGFGSANIKGVYFDEENRRHLNTIRATYADGAAGLADRNRKDEAKQMLDMADKGILEENMPYAMVSRNNQHNYFSLKFLEASYKAGYKEMADKVSKAIHKDLDQQISYYSQLRDSKQEAMRSEIASAQQMKQMLNMLDNQYKTGSTIQPSLEGSIPVGPAKPDTP
ncbi:DUF2723 domain-containing protein [Flavihumibacter solisilvae]|uniref:DUF2723 domain-containing protein n=1 Tax=Flavihumibacter solisilvae TaxID=1349421 RepID=A0A0C1KYD7_9BACT|nr:DUF2723 domain-containing protein [Flavihumibacter solisilvae]KIC92732.1 hypothetical protein OI18_21300 [Flavihumibacter solisilvae]